MAFKYADGKVYENDFHYWYVNGARPKGELKVEIPEDKKEGWWPEKTFVVNKMSAERGKLRGWTR